MIGVACVVFVMCLCTANAQSSIPPCLPPNCIDDTGALARTPTPTPSPNIGGGQDNATTEQPCLPPNCVNDTGAFPNTPSTVPGDEETGAPQNVTTEQPCLTSNCAVNDTGVFVHPNQSSSTPSPPLGSEPTAGPFSTNPQCLPPNCIDDTGAFLTTSTPTPTPSPDLAVVGATEEPLGNSDYDCECYPVPSDPNSNKTRLRCHCTKRAGANDGSNAIAPSIDSPPERNTGGKSPNVPVPPSGDSSGHPPPPTSNGNQSDAEYFSNTSAYVGCVKALKGYHELARPLEPLKDANGTRVQIAGVWTLHKCKTADGFVSALLVLPEDYKNALDTCVGNDTADKDQYIIQPLVENSNLITSKAFQVGDELKPHYENNMRQTGVEEGSLSKFNCTYGKIEEVERYPQITPSVSCESVPGFQDRNRAADIPESDEGFLSNKSAAAVCVEMKPAYQGAEPKFQFLEKDGKRVHIPGSWKKYECAIPTERVYAFKIQELWRDLKGDAEGMVSAMVSACTKQLGTAALVQPADHDDSMLGWGFAFEVDGYLSLFYRLSGRCAYDHIAGNLTELQCAAPGSSEEKGAGGSTTLPGVQGEFPPIQANNDSAAKISSDSGSGSAPPGSSAHGSDSAPKFLDEKTATVACIKMHRARTTFTYYQPPVEMLKDAKGNPLELSGKWVTHKCSYGDQYAFIIEETDYKSSFDQCQQNKTGPVLLQPNDPTNNGYHAFQVGDEIKHHYHKVDRKYDAKGDVPVEKC